ncbi:hypothetical protein TNCV_4011791 [Trichonephila clavipes]|nr:hypothetical protein TNCV_4011791 [Trichonephila clavipes]
MLTSRKVFSEESEWKSESSYWLLKSKDNGSGKMAAHGGNNDYRRVWRQNGHRYTSTYFALRQTNPTSGLSMFDHRTAVILIDAHFTMANTSCKTCCFTLVEGRTQHSIPARQWQFTFTRRTLNILIGIDFHPWSANFPDLNLIVPFLYLNGCDVNRGPLARPVDDLCTTVDVAREI